MTLLKLNRGKNNAFSIGLVAFPEPLFHKLKATYGRK